MVATTGEGPADVGRQGRGLPWQPSADAQRRGGRNGYAQFRGRDKLGGEVEPSELERNRVASQAGHTPANGQHIERPLHCRTIANREQVNVHHGPLEVLAERSLYPTRPLTLWPLEEDRSVALKGPGIDVEMHHDAEIVDQNSKPVKIDRPPQERPQVFAIRVEYANTTGGRQSRPSLRQGGAIRKDQGSDPS